MFPFSLATGGGSVSGGTSRSGDIGAQSFGGFGGLTLGAQGVDSRWLIGGAVAIAFLLALILTKRR